MSDKVTLKGRKPTDTVSIVTPMEVQNVSFMDLASTTASAIENDPFAKLGMKADRWKAYMDFDIVAT